MSNSEPVKLSSIGQIAITFRDLEKAVEFYRDTLGLKFLFAAPPSLAFFDCDGVRLMFTTPEKEEFDHPASILYFKVEDIGGVYRRLKESGVEFEGEPHLVHRDDKHELHLAFFRDPERHLLGLMSEVPI